MTALIFACFSGVSFAQEIVHVHITYSGGDPQGDFLLVSHSRNRFSLKPISGDLENSPDVQIDGIVPALKKKFPLLAKNIAVKSVEPKVSDLIKAGTVLILGQVENPGVYPPAELGTSIAEAVPTKFGSLKRVQLIRDGKSTTYDVNQKTFFGIKLQPGDILLVPMIRWLGR
jgi:hypothetical protein